MERSHYTLLGVEVSLYTGKVRAYLRYKRIPFTEVVASAEVLHLHNNYVFKFNYLIIYKFNKLINLLCELLGLSNSHHPKDGRQLRMWHHYTFLSNMLADTATHAHTQTHTRAARMQTHALSLSDSSALDTRRRDGSAGHDRHHRLPRAQVQRLHTPLSFAFVARPEVRWEGSHTPRPSVYRFPANPIYPAAPCQRLVSLLFEVPAHLFGCRVPCAVCRVSCFVVRAVRAAYVD